MLPYTKVLYELHKEEIFSLRGDECFPPRRLILVTAEMSFRHRGEKSY